MKLSPSHSEQARVSTAFTFQRYAFSACILLAPLSITLYLVSWEGNGRAPLMPLIVSAMAGPTGNTLHFIGAIAASFEVEITAFSVGICSSPQEVVQETQALEQESKRERGHGHRVQLVPYIGERGGDDTRVTHAKLRVRYNIIEIQHQFTPELAF